MRFSKKITISVAFLIIFFSFAFKLYLTYNSPIGFDEAGVSYIAKEINFGKELYGDYFDHKPPFMHYLLSLIYSFVNPTNFSIKLIALLIDSILIVSVFFASKSFLGKEYALYSASIISLFNLSLSLNTELVMTIFGLFGTYFYLKAIEKDKISKIGIFIAGIFIAISIWFKQSAIFFYFPLIAHLFYLNKIKRIDKKEALKSGTILTLGVLFISLPLLSYFFYKTGGTILYNLIYFNLKFNASTGRIFQIGKGLNIFLTQLGFLIAISLFYILDRNKEPNKDQKNILSLLIIFNLFIIFFIFSGKEIFYQHFFQLFPFTVLLAIISLKNSDDKSKNLIFLIILFSSLMIFVSAAEINLREIRSGSLENQEVVLKYLQNNIPKDSTFFSDNPIYSLLGSYNLNQPLIGIAPTFASVFDYSFVCNLDYLVLTHRQKYLSQEEQQCIKDNYLLNKRFDGVGESFVEIWENKRFIS